MDIPPYGGIFFPCCFCHGTVFSCFPDYYFVFYFMPFDFFSFCFSLQVSITDGEAGIQVLKPLSVLVPVFLAASRAPSTVKGYHTHFRKWKAWAAKFPDVEYFPASDNHFALYLISLLQSGYSFSTIVSTFYSINFFHSSCAVRNPCNSGFVKAILEGCKRPRC